MKKISDIRAALATALADINGGGVFYTRLLPANIHDTFSNKIMLKREERDYPKACITLEDGKFEKRPSNCVFTTLNLLVVLAVKNNGERDIAAQIKIEKFVEDLEIAVNLNSTLGGLVEDLSLVDFETDGGFTDPEGIAACSLIATYIDEG